MEIEIIGNIGDKTGIGNYSTKLFYELKNQDMDVKSNEPSLNFPFLEITLRNFIEVPIKVLKSSSDIVHLTNQQRAAGLAFFPKRLLSNVVVTVHDISPYVNEYSGPVSQAVSWFYCRALRKIPRIIAISEFTKSELIEYLKIPEEKIDVVYQGVDKDYFYPRKKNERTLKRYNIETPYLLYVGSEINRKNMKGVFEKFKKLQKENPELILVKAGHPGRQKYREKTLKYLDELDLEKGEDVIFTGFVEEKDLPQIYSSAESTIIWSHYEGFGRTALESEACGTPVITKDEPPMNEWLPKDRFEKRSFSKELSESKIVTWQESATKTREVYKELLTSNSC